MQKRIVGVLHSLTGHNASEMVEKGSIEDVTDYAKKFDFSECEERIQTLPHLDYVDTTNGVDIYYNTGTDSYLFCTEDKDDKVGDPEDSDELSDIDRAKATLKQAGYYVDCLWCVNDVKPLFKECTDEQAQEILNSALSNEYTVGEINTSLSDIGESKGLELIDDNE